MSSEQLRFGLIGTGRIGKVHAASIAALPETVLTWVVDPYLAGAERIAAGTLWASGMCDSVRRLRYCR